MEALICYVTCPSEDIAKSIARAVVNEALAACVNVIPQISSIYYWQAALHEDLEVLLIIKTNEAKRSALEARIIELHPYDTPEFIAVPTTYTNPRYEAWLLSSLDR